MLQKVITNFGEILNRVLTIHFGQDVVVPRLNRDMDEGEHSGVVEEMGNGPEMFKHVGRVGHADL